MTRQTPFTLESHINRQKIDPKKPWTQISFCNNGSIAMFISPAICQDFPCPYQAATLNRSTSKLIPHLASVDTARICNIYTFICKHLSGKRLLEVQLKPKTPFSVHKPRVPSRGKHSASGRTVGKAPWSLSSHKEKYVWGFLVGCSFFCFIFF